MAESSSYLHLLRKLCTVLRLRCLTRVRRRVEAPARRGPTPPTGCGGGGGEHDYEADRQKLRFRLEQGRSRHRHLAIVLMHDGIAGSVDHTTQSEQTTARHALEEENS